MLDIRTKMSTKTEYLDEIDEALDTLEWLTQCDEAQADILAAFAEEDGGIEALRLRLENLLEPLSSWVVDHQPIS